MKQKLELGKSYTLEQLQQEVDNGARFVSFAYCISIIFAVTLTRFSPIILINENQRASDYKRKYDRLSRIFGWWGIPWGPIITKRCLNLNKEGGVDLTDDVMLNISEQALKDLEIELVYTNDLFEKPDKWDTKAFRSALIPLAEKNYNIKSIVVGLPLNVDDDRHARYTIGLKVDSKFDVYIESFTAELRKKFQKQTVFDFIDLNEEEEYNRILEKQGQLLFQRTSF